MLVVRSGSGPGNVLAACETVSNAAPILSLAAAIALGLASVRLAWLLGRPLALVVLAITLAAALAPLAGWLDRQMPRSLAVVVVYAALAAIVIAAAAFVVPALNRELDDLLKQAPDLLSRLHARMTYFVPAGSQLQQASTAALQQWLPKLAALPLHILAGAFELLVLVFLSLYFLIAGPRLHHFLTSLVPPRRRGFASRLLCAIARAMGGYVRGVAIDGVIVGILTWAALTAVGLPYAVPLAVLAGLGELVPYIGPVIAAVPAIAVALVESPTLALTVGIIYLVLQQIESHVITPNVVHAGAHHRSCVYVAGR
jgi:predicted PurR-regulated permease PerM